MYITTLWARYKNKTSPVLNGKVFEGLIACALYRAKILPLFVEAKVAFIPNVSFDFIAYREEFGPIILSVKTSLRERYKQADLEGMMLRQVHRRAQSYLLTLNSSEAKSVNKKIKNGEVLGIDNVVDVTTPDFDILINTLKSMTFYTPPQINVITGQRIIK
jgi:hypothetical protein